VTPKIELHLHLEGSIRPATLLDIARRNAQPLPADTVDGLARLYEFTDFAHFVEVWILTTQCLRTAGDFQRVVVDYAAEAASFGAVYVEGIFSPCERVQRGVRWDEIFEGYTDGAIEASERHGVTIRFTPDLYRGVPPDLAEECARMAVRYRERGVVGLGLGGMESARPATEYSRAFDIARDGGLALVPHAGESAGAESIWEALSFEPARIRHASAPWRTPHCSPRSSIAAWCSTSARRQTCGPAWCPQWTSIRCRPCGRPGSHARSTPTTRRCSAPTSAGSTRWRSSSG
jgi:aminodeoxyfutalosine deaminase